MQPPAISSVDAAGLAELLDELGAEPWRAGQIRAAAWRPAARGFEHMPQLPAPLRAALAHRLRFTTVDVTGSTPADGGHTIKLLCRLDDGQTVETVAMESPARPGRRRRTTVCVSTQVGCAVGCPFCATGLAGLRRSCTAAEIADQVRAAATRLDAVGLGPVTHVVYMGMGEPLAAYGATVGSIRALMTGAGISPRRITVSTSGVVPAIDRLAAEGLPVTLAISLHAADDALRDRLVPLNRAHGLPSLLAAAVRYRRATGRRVTFEWCLIAGVNDSVDDADRLAELASRTGAHVNVIPMNPVAGSPYRPPSEAVTARFLERLRGITATVRDTRGAATDAACGQLRAQLEQRRLVGADGRLGPPRPRASPPAGVR